MSRQIARSPAWVGAAVLLVAVIGGAGALAAWKSSELERSAHASDGMPEPSEAVTMAVAEPREHQPSTSAVGTVLALRSVTLRNELAGTVRQVRLTPGQVVEPGTVLVALDVSVEAASLKAEEARAALAETTLHRPRGLRAGEGGGGGRVLRAPDGAVEAASLKAEEARAALAETTLHRLERLLEHN